MKLKKKKGNKEKKKNTEPADQSRPWSRIAISFAQKWIQELDPRN